MARNRETKIELTAYDDLFQTDESREEAKLSKIRDIPISEIDEFPDQRWVSEKSRNFITEIGGIGEKLMPLLHSRRGRKIHTFVVQL